MSRRRVVVVGRRGEVRVGFVASLGLNLSLNLGLVSRRGPFRCHVVFRLQPQLHVAADNRVQLAAHLDRIVRILRLEGREAAGYGKSIAAGSCPLLVGEFVRQRDRLPAVLLGHRAILGQRVWMSRRRDVSKVLVAKPKVARAKRAKTCTGEKTGVMAGVMTGAVAGVIADVVAGAVAEAVAGVVAGAAARVVTGAATGVATGVMAGVVTGVIAGVMSGVVAGVMAGVIAGAIAGVLARAITGVATGLMTGVMTGAAIPPARVSFPGK